ncbi:MAG: hypothetical protein AB8G15_11925 [Saprospiraceae bacterium]
MSTKSQFRYSFFFLILFVWGVPTNAQSLDAKKELEELQYFEKQVNLMNQAFNNKDQAYLNRIHATLKDLIKKEIKQQQALADAAKKKIATGSPVLLLDQMTEQEYLDLDLPNPSKAELRLIRFFEQKNILRILERNSFSLRRENSYKVTLARKSIYRFMESMGNDIRELDPKLLPVETKV